MIRVRRLIKKALFAATVVVATGFLFTINAFADGKATVTADSAYVRSNASTSGTVVGSAAKNDVYDVLGSETDSNGYTWYKIRLSDGSTTGYIRSDLVTTEGVSAKKEETTTKVPQVEVTVEQTIATEAEPVGGSVTGDVRVREGASTNHKVVDNAKANTAVTVTGFATASDGKQWLRVT